MPGEFGVAARGRRPVRRRARLSKVANARATIAGFGKDEAIAFGLTFGQFSLLDRTPW